MQNLHVDPRAGLGSGESENSSKPTDRERQAVEQRQALLLFEASFPRVFPLYLRKQLGAMLSLSLSQCACGSAQGLRSGRHQMIRE